MAIHPKCDMCGVELKELGAILLSPPDEASKVDKIHLCQDCYKKVLAIIK